MTRLIDADELMKYAHDVTLGNGARHRCIDATVIYAIPKIDAVPVIRCRDCKHCDGFDCSRYADETYGISHSTQEYGYCWLAERREHETD